MNKIKNILFSPSKFFADVKKEKGVKKAFNFLVIYYLIFIFLSSIVFFVSGNKGYYALLGLNLSSREWILVFIGTYFFGLLLSFASAFLLKAWIKLFDGKGKYEDAYKLKIYSNLPSYIFGWIPIINWFSWIYSIILLIIGTKTIYKFSTIKATLIYIIPLAILFFILLIFFIIFFFLVGNGLSEPVL